MCARRVLPRKARAGAVLFNKRVQVINACRRGMVFCSGLRSFAICNVIRFVCGFVFWLRPGSLAEKGISRPAAYCKDLLLSCFNVIIYFNSSADAFRRKIQY